MEDQKQQLLELKEENETFQREIHKLELRLATAKDDERPQVEQQIRDVRIQQREIELVIHQLRAKAELAAKESRIYDDCFKVISVSEGIQPEQILGYRARLFYDPNFYYVRDVDQLIDQNVKEKRDVLFITGNPLAGKSRAVLEALKRLGQGKVIITDMKKVGEPVALPPHDHTSTIAYLDDIDTSFIQFKDAANALVKQFLERRIKVVATCRTGPELDKLRYLMDQDLWLLFYANKVEIKPLTNEVSHNLRRISARQLHWNNYDGNIGSLFMDLDAMRKRYASLWEKGFDLSAAILLAMKCHYYQMNYEGNRSTYSEGKIWEFARRYMHEKAIQRRAWDEALRVLITEEFHLNFVHCDGEWIRIEEVYLDHGKAVVAPDFDPNRLMHLVSNLYHTPQEKVSAGFPVSVKDFGRLMNRTNSFDDALQVYGQVLDHGLKPNAFIFSMLIKRAPDFRTAMSLLEQMKKDEVNPDSWCYNPLIAKAPDFETAMSLLEQMENVNITPDTVTLGTLMDKAPDFKTAMSLLEQMKKLKIPPNDVVFGTLMGKASDFATAMSLLEQMKNLKIPPNDVVFGTLMDKAPDFETAVSLFEQMKNLKIPPNDMVFGRLMGKASDFATAMSLLEQMKKEGVTPAELSYTLVLSRSDDFKEAYEFFTTIPLLELESHKSIDGALVQVAKKKPNEAFTYLIAHFTPKDMFSSRLLNTIIQEACLATLDAEDFAKEYQQYIRDESDDIICFYAKRFQQLGKSAVALGFLELMRDKGFAYHNTMGNCLRATNRELAFQSFERAKDLAQDPQQSRVTLTNIAGLVYETEFATQYQYAISCCEQAIALVDSYQDFPYPTHFLYLIRIRMTAVEELEELMAQLRISYPVGKQSLRALIQTVDDDKKRGLLMECLLPVRET